MYDKYMNLAKDKTTVYTFIDKKKLNFFLKNICKLLNLINNHFLLSIYLGLLPI